MEIFGWGKKNTADVTEKGQLKTASTSFTEDHEAALNGDAYTMDIDNVTVAANNNYLFVIKKHYYLRQPLAAAAAAVKKKIH